jgi:hypothetical protein
MLLQIAILRQSIMNALSIKGFLRIALLLQITSGIVISLICWLSSDVGWTELAWIGLGSVEIGFFFAACCYLVQVTRDMRRLRLSPEEMSPSECVIMEASCGHFHARPGATHVGPLNSVGGRLILTTHRLVFLAHRGQPWHYKLFVPLEDVAKASMCDLFGVISGGLRVNRIDGDAELFNFGAMQDLNADRWAAAILRARYHLNPDLG